MTQTAEPDVVKVKMTRHSKYLGQWSFRSKVIVWTHTHTPDRVLYLDEVKPEPAIVSAGPWQGSDAIASTERQPITGVWGGDGGETPQQGPWAKPPVGGQGAKPPEAECLLYLACPKEAANLPNF